MMDDQRNLFIWIAIALAVLLLYDSFVLSPARERAQQALEAEQAAQESVTNPETGLPRAQGEAGPSREASALGENADATLTREDALAASTRVRIETPELEGSISLTGARLDDLSLTAYTRELDPASGVVTLLNPQHAPGAYYAVLGWTSAESELADLPGPETEWRLASGNTLTPDTPIRLVHDTPEGLAFERRIEVDEHYLFTITDRVTNRTGETLSLEPYGLVRRRGIPEDASNYYILHEGMVGVLDNSVVLRKYKRIQKDREFQQRSVGGWLGITDKYWLTALVPQPNAAYQGQFRVVPRADAPLFQADWLMDPVEVADGEVIESTSRVFAGAKRASLLRDYESEYDIDKFDFAIDWGHLWFLTKPFFLLLEYFSGLTGNFGLAILLLTVVVKAVTFPLANTSYKSMARMKQIQPKMAEIRKRYEADSQRQQKEIMALYQREKVNPLAGCLPMIVQIPILYSLYKTLFVTIEMRHAPFFGWIADLSARDPTNVWNLFGLLPYDPASAPLIGALIGGTGALAIGVWPLLYGLTMSATMTLNPPPPDPIQRKIMTFMPWFFMFVLARWSAGLLIYWSWNNTLTFLQQYVIIRRQGVDTPIGSFVSKQVSAAPARFRATRHFLARLPHHLKNIGPLAGKARAWVAARFASRGTPGGGASGGGASGGGASGGGSSGGDSSGSET